MSHGVPTALGRKLRSVLANLSPRRLDSAIDPVDTLTTGSSSRSQPRRAVEWQRALQARHYIQFLEPRSAKASREEQEQTTPIGGEDVAESARETKARRRNGGVAQLVSPEQAQEESFLSGNTVRSGSRRAPASGGGIHNAPTRTRSSGDEVANALWMTGKPGVIPTRSRRRPPLRQSTGARARKEAMSLMDIVARCIENDAKVALSERRPIKVVPFTLTEVEASFLHRKNRSIDDIRALARILSTADSVAAAHLLEERIRTMGRQTVPCEVLVYILRRPYLKASALTAILELCQEIVSQEGSDATSYWSSTTIFVTFKLLCRHAREVNPAALVTAAKLLISRVERERLDTTEPPSLAYLDQISRRLNRAMRLIAIPTAVEPLKDEPIQKAALVHILSFMEQHVPQLHIDRAGYEAVALLQLTQKKTPAEQQWAELKAKSWPPWKENRTAMDADITANEHGFSKAARTIEQMHKAGHAPTTWDEVASIYTGWDTDKTPTIQTRHILQSGGRRFETQTALWAARIDTTRTLQEAWAAYLAYEDSSVPSAMDVYLAMFRKLHQESENSYLTVQHAEGDEDRTRLFPGDASKIQPLPPSTHLYTYTRTPPPTMKSFYEYLYGRGIVLSGYCLAFVLANAPSRELGLRYLHHSSSDCPSLKLFAGWSPDLTVNDIPIPVFTAGIQFLCKFADDPLAGSADPEESCTASSRLAITSHDGMRQALNHNHCLVWAMKLLDLRRPTFMPAWNAVLLGLNAKALRSVLHNTPGVAVARLPSDIEWRRGSILALALAREVISMMSEEHLDLDTVGLQALCLCLENATVGAWRVLLDEQKQDPASAWVFARKNFNRAASQILRPAKALLQSPHHVQYVKQRFWTFVSRSNASPSLATSERSSDETDATDLLATPSPALVHAYIRALGWAADYEGLRDLVVFLSQYASEFAEKAARDRNGKAMTRRAIVALRMFLERRWWLDNVPLAADDQQEAKESSATQQQLRRLARPAPAELIATIRELVVAHKKWGGWPSDAEVEQYGTHRRFEWFAGREGRGGKDGKV